MKTERALSVIDKTVFFAFLKEKVITCDPCTNSIDRAFFSIQKVH